jgi:hypothetical protein
LVQTHCRKRDLTPFVLHRNSSVFKQADPNKRQVKRKNKKKEQGEHQRIYIRRLIKNGGLKGIK